MENKFIVHSDQVDLSTVFDRLKGLTSLQAQLKGLRFTVEYSGPKNSFVLTDDRRILQLLLNLTNNAIKYTCKGEIAVTARMLPNCMLAIQVRDTGVGIEQDNIHKIFDMFGLVDHKTKACETGCVTRVTLRLGIGMGLFLCKSIVEKLGGRLNVNSDKGKGTQFDIELPMSETRPELTSWVSFDIVTPTV